MKLIYIYWLARILSLFNILFILYFVGAHAFSSSFLKGATPTEITAFVFFPIGVFIGLIFSWKKPLTGGLITIFSLMIFYIVMPNAIDNFWINFLAFPGLLFILYSLLNRKK